MFLTNLDPRAAIKGSRDPLGLVPLWSQFGRQLVGNLTTVTGSVRGFTTTLLGYHFAREVQERVGGGKGESTLALFLKFEQLAAYCRYAVNKDGEFRGVERVKRNLAASMKVAVSAGTEHQILSNQKVYGLWGLFSGPARASGLLERDEAVLTPAARDFVEEQYLGFLKTQGFRDGRDVVELLRQPTAQLHLDGKHANLARAIARLHGPKFTEAERRFYWDHLALGGSSDSTSGLQRQLVKLMGGFPAEKPFDRHELRALIKEARRRGWDSLSHRLQCIEDLESVLVPAGEAFGFLLARSGQPIEAVAKELVKAWGALKLVDVAAVRPLQSEIGKAFPEAAAGERWVKLAEALAAGDFEQALRLLIEHNAFVMKARNGSEPWVRITKGLLAVRFRDEASQLSERKVLPDLWVNNYFLNPLKAVVVTLREG
jgi:hypothetical protein